MGKARLLFSPIGSSLLLVPCEFHTMCFDHICHPTNSPKIHLPFLFNKLSVLTFKNLIHSNLFCLCILGMWPFLEHEQSTMTYTFRENWLSSSQHLSLANRSLARNLTLGLAPLCTLGFCLVWHSIDLMHSL